MQKASREVFKKTSVKVTAKAKENLLTKVAGKNFQETEKEVASFFAIPVAKKSSVRIQADGSVRVELTLSKGLYKKIQQAQALLSHAPTGSDLESYIEYVTDKVINRRLQSEILNVLPPWQ